MPDNEFTPGDATDVAYKCTIATTLSNHPLIPNDTLHDYGVWTSEQILLIKSRIRTNKEFGLPHHGRSIDPNALKDIDTDTQLAALSDTIYDQSFVVSGRVGRARADTVSNTSRAIVEFTRQNPVQALMITAALGMLMGFVIGSMRR